MNQPYPAPGYPQQFAGGYPAQPGYPMAPPTPAPVDPGTVDDFFSNAGGGSGAPSFKFTQVDSGLIGTIVSMQPRQRTELATGRPLFNANDGRPQIQLEVTLQTALRNWQGTNPEKPPTGPDGKTPLPPEADTGLRRIYLWYTLRDAVTEALQRAEVARPAIGGTLGVKVSGFMPNPKGGNPIKLYTAVYTAPAQDTTGGFFDPATQQTAPQAQPQYAPPPAQPGPVAAAQQAFAQPQYAPPPTAPVAPPAWGPAAAAQSTEPPF